MPFLCSNGGGLHESLIDVDERDKPDTFSGAAYGPEHNYGFNISSNGSLKLTHYLHQVAL